MRILFSKHEYKIYGHDNAYIIHNTKKEFKDGHTHINNYNTAKYLINLAVYKSLPNRKKKYFYDSLIRISKDKIYIDKLKNELKHFYK